MAIRLSSSVCLLVSTVDTQEPKLVPTSLLADGLTKAQIEVYSRTRLRQMDSDGFCQHVYHALKGWRRKDPHRLIASIVIKRQDDGQAVRTG